MNSLKAGNQLGKLQLLGVNLKYLLVIFFVFLGISDFAQEDIFGYGTYSAKTTQSYLKGYFLDEAKYGLKSKEIYIEKSRFIFFKSKKIEEKYQFNYANKDLYNVNRVDFGYRGLGRKFCTINYYCSNSFIDSTRWSCSFIKNYNSGDDFIYEGDRLIEIYPFYNKRNDSPITIYTYDSLNRISKINGLNFIYNQKGKITSVQNEKGEVYEKLKYDSTGFLKEQLFKQINNYFDYSIKYEYFEGKKVKVILDKLDSNGNFLERAGEVKYEYYKNGKLKEIDFSEELYNNIYEEEYFYYPNGLIKELHHYNKRKKLKYKFYYKYTYVKD